MPNSPRARADLQAAVDQANAAIRTYLRSLPGWRAGSAGERAEYHRLVDAYLAAVEARDGGGEAARAA